MLRGVSHLLILGMVVLFSWMARPELWSWLPARLNLPGSLPTATPTLEPASPEVATSASLLFPPASSAGAISPVISLHTDLPSQPRAEVVPYSVQPGDTIYGIAAKFNLQPSTILWSNYGTLGDDPERIQAGQVLNILPVDGAYYQWQAGNSLAGLAQFFGVTPQEIVAWPGNHLPSSINLAAPPISPGTWLVIPGGHRAFVQWQVPLLSRMDKTKWSFGGPGACQGPYLSSLKGEGYWVWPTDSHVVSGNPYSSFHPAIDLQAALGSKVYAAASGVVMFAGWSTGGHGNLIVIDHGNGWQTVYGFLGKVLVTCGTNVYQSSVIGLAGATGNATTPQLYFEIQNVSLGNVNPLSVLP
ncbi:MAG: peptidoglycan DD-metalloendopeptidase family protein [Anaerolineales bacterium]